MAFTVKMIDSPAKAAARWPAARARIAAAMAECTKPPSLLSVKDVENAVRLGDASLWEVIDETGNDVASYVTEIVRASNGAAVNVMAIGGDQLEEWVEVASQALREYMTQLGCLYVFERGRPGWKRILSRHGWSDGPATMIMVA